jgi:hypothetical protein
MDARHYWVAGPTGNPEGHFTGDFVGGNDFASLGWIETVERDAYSFEYCGAVALVLSGSRSMARFTMTARAEDYVQVALLLAL